MASGPLPEPHSTGWPISSGGGASADPGRRSPATRARAGAARAHEDPAIDDDPPPRQPPDWEMYRALREQWTHEDNLVNHRLMWLILSQGLLFTAYGTLSTAKLHWLVIGFPFFGIAVAAVIGVSIFAALHAIEEVGRQYDEAGLGVLCKLSPGRHRGNQGQWAAQSLPFVFGALWLLAFIGAFGA